MRETDVPIIGVLLFIANSLSIVIRIKMKEATKKIVTVAKRIRVASVLPSATEILCSIGERTFYHRSCEISIASLS